MGDTTNRIEQEHARLKELVQAVRAADGDAMRTAIGQLAYYLAGHFGAEESDHGWMSDAIEHAPHHAGVIDDLKSEHGAMLAAANGMAAGHGDDTAIETLLSSIEEHERREATVITDVWYEELGTGD